MMPLRQARGRCCLALRPRTGHWSHDGEANRVIRRIGQYGPIQEAAVKGGFPELKELKHNGPNEATLIGARSTFPVTGGADWICADDEHWLFYGPKAACFACHTVKNEGGQVGPDLTKIGAIRSNRDLLVAIVFPSASFARGFEPYEITTKDGKFYPAGIIRRETADALHIVTGDRVEVRIPRSEIETVVPGKVSIMPDGLDNQISRQELSDLIAFLMTLK
jgi:putative heme-binding domain-containing protein